MTRNVSKPRRRRGLTAWSVTTLGALLILPGMAISCQALAIDLQWALGYALFISALAFLLYRHDKRRAESGGWRTPERTLHLVEILGGWPGAFLAQRAFRHKNAKPNYQAVFWAIVLFYECASFDFLLDWRYSRRILVLLHSENRRTQD